MKKETGIAVGLGVFFGLLFSFVVILNTQTDKAVTRKKQVTQTRPATTQGNTVARPIEIVSPNDRTVFDTKETTITLKVEKDSFVVIQTSSQDIAIEAESETISQAVQLTLGENIVHISVYPKERGAKIQEKQLKIYYIPTT